MNNDINLLRGRRALLLRGLSLLLLSACKEKPMEVFLHISLFNYSDRPIYDVDMNGTDFMSAMDHDFHGSNSVMLMQPITLGPQHVTWKLDGPEGAPRNGELVTAKNVPRLDVVPREMKWLALHIYDDATVEIKLSRGTASELETVRGKEIISAWESKK